MKVENVTGYETGRYNPETCCNGGGYWQFAGTVQYEGWTIEIDDTSCGGYGDRCFFQVTCKNGTAWVWYNTMLSDCTCDPDNDWGNSSQNWDTVDPDCILTPDVLMYIREQVSEAAWTNRQ